MPKYIILLNWTEQGIKSVKDSPKRYDAANDVGKSLGCTLETIYLTFGQYDQVAIMDAPSDEAAAQFLLKVAALGNIRAQTLRAFEEADYRRMVASV